MKYNPFYALLVELACSLLTMFTVFYFKRTHIVHNRQFIFSKLFLDSRSIFNYDLGFIKKKLLTPANKETAVESLQSIYFEI